MSNIAPSCRSPAARYDSYLTRSSPSVRDYVLEGDSGGMRHAMNHIADEEKTICMHHEALQAIEDAALARALVLSEETALQEERRRVRRSKPHISSTRFTQSLPEKTDSVPYSFLTRATAGSSAKGRANSESNQAGTRADVASTAIDPMDDVQVVPLCSQVSNATSSDDSAYTLSVHVAGQAQSYSRDKSPRNVNCQCPAEQSGSSSQNTVIDDRKTFTQNDFSAPNDGPDFSQELFSNVRFFAPPRKCCYCDQYVERVHNSVRSSDI